MPRIKTRPDELRDQLSTAAAAAIAAGASWPASAPTPGSITAAANAINTILAQIAVTEGTLATQRQTRDVNVAAALAIMKAIDEATDFLYGAGGAEKLNFGLAPKGQGSLEALHKLEKIRTLDGLPSHSILFDWETIENSSYEIQWFTDAALTNAIGSAVSTKSEFTITGLDAGTQYWMIVRPFRGGQFGPWSDPATRIAPV